MANGFMSAGGGSVKSTLGTAKTLTIGKSYTAETDGYINVTIPYNTSPDGKMCTISVDGKDLFRVNPSAYNGNSHSIYVKKGMSFIVDASGITVTASFIPIE